MIRFVGVDPGKVTGLTSFTVDENDGINCVEHYQVGLHGAGQYFEDPLANWGSPDVIVCMESFIITPGTTKKTQAPWSLETIGVVRYFVEKAGGSLRMSAPSAHKKLISDDVLKRAGLHFPGEGHATDAARVALNVAIVDHKLARWTLRS
jgi:hypothetical protein